MGKVFISYAREDAEVALRLYRDLQSAGFSPWLDTKDLLPGQNWSATIKKQILESSHFLTLISSRSVNKSGFYQKEIRLALDVLDQQPPGKIYAIPVRLDKTSPSHDSLRDLHWVDLFPDYKIGLAAIILALGKGKDTKTSSLTLMLENAWGEHFFYDENLKELTDTRSLSRDDLDELVKPGAELITPGRGDKILSEKLDLRNSADVQLERECYFEHMNKKFMLQRIPDEPPFRTRKPYNSVFVYRFKLKGPSVEKIIRIDGHYEEHDGYTPDQTVASIFYLSCGTLGFITTSLDITIFWGDDFKHESFIDNAYWAAEYEMSYFNGDPFSYIRSFRLKKANLKKDYILLLDPDKEQRNFSLQEIVMNEDIVPSDISFPFTGNTEDIRGFFIGDILHLAVMEEKRVRVYRAIGSGIAEGFRNCESLNHERIEKISVVLR